MSYRWQEYKILRLCSKVSYARRNTNVCRAVDIITIPVTRTLITDNVYKVEMIAAVGNSAMRKQLILARRK
jgi:hypothetical protein